MTANPNSTKKRLLVPTFHTLEILEIQDIVSVQAFENYSRLQLSNKQIITSTHSFGRFLKILNRTDFYQCHKSYIINLSHMLRYHKSGEVEMTCGAKIPVARRRKDEFFECLMKVA